MESSPGVLETTDVLVVGTNGWEVLLTDVIKTTGAASVRTETTIEGAMAAYASHDVDCILTGYELADGTGIDLLRELRTEMEDLPVIVCTSKGDETVASDAIGTGASDYIAVSNPSTLPSEKITERVTRALHASQRTSTRRDRARQFDAVFRNTQTATWVLDASGQLRRANETARGLMTADIGDVVGEFFWRLPWFPRTEQTQSDIHQLITNVIEHHSTERIVTDAGDEDRTLELSILPVEDPEGTLEGVVVEGDDITERVSLYRDLRSSEELHRVTLNNMTDTVLVTDDDGTFTYICPNVHFIFGHSVEEVRQLGTIDELLGNDLFDREELAEAGVLKNIERTVTDKAGRSHTLLVNVREVSIQDGRILYSCRDITKRKQREEALATLHETTRDFLYSDTQQEIAHRIVEDVPKVLDYDTSAVYLFDTDDNELQPVAWTPLMERLHGPLHPVPPNADDPVSYCFVEDEARFFDDVKEAGRFEPHSTDIRSAAYIPLGDHGVFLAGTDEPGKFDEMTRELADLLAATAEAALDRVRRERTLREQDRELQRRYRELSALNRINEIIREIDQALVQAQTREEIDHAVCERLTANSRFTFAWIGVIDSTTETVEPRAWAGREGGYLDALSIPVSETKTEPAGLTAASEEVTTIGNVASQLREEPWRKEALLRDYLSVISVPIAYDEFTYGVLTVYAESQDAFDETAKTVLTELGETIASATSAIERKNALLTTTMTRMEFDIDDPSFVLTRLAQKADCSLSYQGGVQQTADGCNVFVTLDGTTGETVDQVAAELLAITDIQRISSDETRGVFRLRLSEPFLALELADHGAVLRRASVDETTTTLIVDIPESVDVRRITQLITETYADVDLRSKRTLDQLSAQTGYSQFIDRVTDRQLEVLQTAYYSGFFEQPRESTGEEIADTLGVSPQAFYQHTRTVQQKLFETLFDEVGAHAIRQG